MVLCCSQKASSLAATSWYLCIFFQTKAIQQVLTGSQRSHLQESPTPLTLAPFLGCRRYRISELTHTEVRAAAYMFIWMNRWMDMFSSTKVQFSANFPIYIHEISIKSHHSTINILMQSTYTLSLECIHIYKINCLVIQVSWNGGTPSHHPFWIRMLPYQPNIFWAPHDCGNRHRSPVWIPVAETNFTEFLPSNAWIIRWWDVTGKRGKCVGIIKWRCSWRCDYCDWIKVVVPAMNCEFKQKNNGFKWI